MVFTNLQPRYGVIALFTLIIFGCATPPPSSDTELQTRHQREPVATEPVVIDEQQQLTERQQLLAKPNLYLASVVEVTPYVKEQMQQALVAKQQGDVAQAQALLLAIAEQNPQLSAPKVHLGDIAMHNAQLELALTYYQQAIAINQHNYYALNRVGVIYRKLGRFSDAKASYQAAINSWPAFAPAYLNLGILLDIYLGEKAAALASYQTHQALDENKNQQVAGWIADLSAQIRRAAKRKG